MKKAKIYLTLIALLAIVGGALAFKAKKFNADPVWRYTRTITIAGNVFSSTQSFCTSAPTTLFKTAVGIGDVSVVSTTLVPPTTSITLTGLAGSLTIPFYTAANCVPLETFVTTAP